MELPTPDQEAHLENLPTQQDGRDLSQIYSSSPAYSPDLEQYGRTEIKHEANQYGRVSSNNEEIDQHSSINTSNKEAEALALQKERRRLKKIKEQEVQDRVDEAELRLQQKVIDNNFEEWRANQYFQNDYFAELYEQRGQLAAFEQASASLGQEQPEDVHADKDQAVTEDAYDGDNSDDDPPDEFLRLHDEVVYEGDNSDDGPPSELLRCTDEELAEYEDEDFEMDREASYDPTEEYQEDQGEQDVAYEYETAYFEGNRPAQYHEHIEGAAFPDQINFEDISQQSAGNSGHPKKSSTNTTKSSKRKDLSWDPHGNHISSPKFDAVRAIKALADGSEGESEDVAIDGGQARETALRRLTGELEPRLDPKIISLKPDEIQVASQPSVAVEKSYAVNYSHDSSSQPVRENYSRPRGDPSSTIEASYATQQLYARESSRPTRRRPVAIEPTHPAKNDTQERHRKPTAIKPTGPNQTLNPDNYPRLGRIRPVEETLRYHDACLAIRPKSPIPQSLYQQSTRNDQPEFDSGENKQPNFFHLMSKNEHELVDRRTSSPYDLGLEKKQGVPLPSREATRRAQFLNRQKMQLSSQKFREEASRGLARLKIESNLPEYQEQVAVDKQQYRTPVQAPSAPRNPRGRISFPQAFENNNKNDSSSIPLEILVKKLRPEQSPPSPSSEFSGSQHQSNSTPELKRFTSHHRIFPSSRNLLHPHCNANSSTTPNKFTRARMGLKLSKSSPGTTPLIGSSHDSQRSDNHELPEIPQFPSLFIPETYQTVTQSPQSQQVFSPTPSSLNSSYSFPTNGTRGMAHSGVHMEVGGSALERLGAIGELAGRVSFEAQKYLSKSKASKLAGKYLGVEHEIFRTLPQVKDAIVTSNVDVAGGKFFTALEKNAVMAASTTTARTFEEMTCRLSVVSNSLFGSKSKKTRFMEIMGEIHCALERLAGSLQGYIGGEQPEEWIAALEELRLIRLYLKKQVGIIVPSQVRMSEEDKKIAQELSGVNTGRIFKQVEQLGAPHALVTTAQLTALYNPNKELRMTG